jgi:hypothetical protein
MTILKLLFIWNLQILGHGKKVSFIPELKIKDGRITGASPTQMTYLECALENLPRSHRNSSFAHSNALDQ